MFSSATVADADRIPGVQRVGDRSLQASRRLIALTLDWHELGLFGERGVVRCDHVQPHQGHGAREKSWGNRLADDVLLSDPTFSHSTHYGFSGLCLLCPYASLSSMDGYEIRCTNPNHPSVDRRVRFNQEVIHLVRDESNGR